MKVALAMAGVTRIAVGVWATSMLVLAFSGTAWASDGGDTVLDFDLYFMDSLNRAIFNSDSVAGPFGKGNYDVPLSNVWLEQV